MRREPRKLKYEFKRSVCIGLALFLFVVIGGGVRRPKPPQNRDRILKFKAVKVAQKRLGLNKVCVSAGGEEPCYDGRLHSLLSQLLRRCLIYADCGFGYGYR